MTAPRALAIVLPLLGAVLGGGCRSVAIPSAPPPLDPDAVQRGALLFLDPRVSADGTRSCASCHPGGGAIPASFVGAHEVAPATPGGRNTLPLRGVWQTAPYLWDGSQATLRGTLLRMLEVEMGGGRLSERDLAALESYVLSIPPFERGRIEPDGRPREPATLSAKRGFAIFRKLGCERCHPPPSFTRPRPTDLGTGGVFDAPSLRGLADSGPWGHDGRWATLEEAVRAVLRLRGRELSEREIYELISYLKLL
ncbi:MAG: cytochrome-c peroxidase [Myxococcota bacterium]